MELGNNQEPIGEPLIDAQVYQGSGQVRKKDLSIWDLGFGDLGFAGVR